MGAIIAGSIAGAFALLAGYLAFCSWLYRKQLKMYQNHVAMAQRTAFAQSPDRSGNWIHSDESGGRVNEKVAGVGAGAVLGAFGTDIRGSGSAGRPSYNGSSGPSPGLLPGNESGGETSSGHGSLAENRLGGYGGGIMPGGGTAGMGYGPLSEEDETGYEGAGHTAMGNTNWGRPVMGTTANSSVEDLLGGQEPSFFSVVMNPRRTLKVVNLD